MEAGAPAAKLSRSDSSAFSTTIGKANEEAKAQAAAVRLQDVAATLEERTDAAAQVAIDTQASAPAANPPDKKCKCCCIS